MPSQGAALGAKAQQLAALQASIASKLSQVAHHQLALLPFLTVVAHLIVTHQLALPFFDSCCPLV